MNQPRRGSREFADAVARRLRDAGFEALLAGGCVRDLLLGIEPKDYDVATNARPEQVRKLFRRTLAIGASFGVIAVLGQDKQTVEVATFRADGPYQDGRHPVSVQFATAREDALRRDFTINGMFLDPDNDQILDFVGGRSDLDGRVLRAIGDPAARFDEDKLRLLRGIRFAARFDLSVDPLTGDAMRHFAPRITQVSPERILMEVTAFLIPPYRAAALRRLREFCLFATVFPELAALMDDQDRWNRTLAILDYWKEEISLPLALAGLLATWEEQTAAAVADALLERLKGSNADRRTTEWLLRHRTGFDRAAERKRSEILPLFAAPDCEQLLDYHQARSAVLAGSTDDAQAVRELRARLRPDQINPAPILTGDQLIAAGYAPGPQFRDWLARIRDAQLDGLVTDTASALDRVRQWARET